MVAYSFQRRFCDKVATWEKRQTIRAHRARHAKPGEAVQLFFGMRTKHCRKLIAPDPVCISVDLIKIVVPPAAGIAEVLGLNAPCLAPVTDRFAQLDGFDDAEDFTRFWFDTHGPGDFQGVLIRWGRWMSGAPGEQST